MELVGARLVAVWALEHPVDVEPPPLTEEAVDAVLARRWARRT